MDNITAFAMGQANRGRERKVFDWDKAVKIIKERELKNCGAGLESDFEYTAGMILADGKPVTEGYTYLASNWATPQLIIYDELDKGLFEYEEVVDCWLWESETDYDENTKFPKHLIEDHFVKSLGAK